MSRPMNPVEALILEAENYRDLELISRVKQDAKDLAHIPARPLYLQMKKLGPKAVGKLLPYLGANQRSYCLDIDLWEKDDLDLEQFVFWPLSYAECQDLDVQAEFAASEQFLLFIKGVFNIYTFDVEDPQYPEHDHYFLTEDNLLLFEFDENCPFVEEVQTLIKGLYTEWGVEKAYQHLFKMVSDSFLCVREEMYQNKKRRLEDYGVVDYYDALNVYTPFKSFSQLEKYIQTKTKVTARLDSISKSQVLGPNTLAFFKEGLDSIYEELAKIQDDQQWEFVKFNFVKTLNSLMALARAEKEGSVAVKRTADSAKFLFQLGLSYIKSQVNLIQTKGEGIFEKFTFEDLYRIGNSLIGILKKDLKSCLSKNRFNSENMYFLGAKWGSFINCLEQIPPQYYDFRGDQSFLLNEYRQWKSFYSDCQFFITMIPFIADTLNMKSVSKPIESLNYHWDELDLEALLLTLFFEYLEKDNNFQGDKIKGIKVDKFIKLLEKYFYIEGSYNPTEELAQNAKSFLQFNLPILNNSNGMNYFEAILKGHLEGYDFETMEEEDFQHVGGPLLFKS